MASFDFPDRALYGISVDIDAPFGTQLSLRDPGAAQSNLLPSIIGAWSLVSYSAPSIHDPANILFPLGPDAQGILLYTSDGYMSATLLRPGQAPYASAEPGNASQSELAESTQRYLGYAGPFVLEHSGGRPLVKHMMHLVNFPNWQGNVQTRVLRVDGDELRLGLEGFVDVGGVSRQPVLVWKKMPANPAIASFGGSS
ncbi:MAG: hypothetical protein Q9227_004985 [Pyrenula ochraceoflavens]